MSLREVGVGVQGLIVDDWNGVQLVNKERMPIGPFGDTSPSPLRHKAKQFFSAPSPNSGRSLRVGNTMSDVTP